MQNDNDDAFVTGINVTPMVDIVLVLLIIFMVTTSLVQNTGLKVNLPKAKAAQDTEMASVTLALDARGNLSLDDKPLAEAGLVAALEDKARANPELRVVLRADKSLDYGRVVRALDEVKQAGISRVALAAER